jgi:hypothetical protein
MTDNIAEIGQGGCPGIDGIMIGPHAGRDYLKNCQILLKGKCSGGYLKCHLCEFKDKEILVILNQKMILKVRRTASDEFY